MTSLTDSKWADPSSILAFCGSLDLQSTQVRKEDDIEGILDSYMEINGEIGNINIHDIYKIVEEIAALTELNQH